MDLQDKTIIMNDDLKNRLYDVGFNLQTLPSVKRPQIKASKEKPMIIKIKSQNKNEKEFRQSSILNFFKPPQKQINLLTEEDNSQKQTFTSRFKSTQTGTFHNPQSHLPKTSRFDTKSKLYKTNSCLKKKNLISQTDFTRDDLIRTKVLVNKVTGKLDLDQRYQNKIQIKNFTPTQIFVQSKAKLRTDTDIDKYLAMCQKNETYIDNFVYMIQNNPEDPYDLKFYDYSKIRIEKKKEFFTFSQKGLTLFFNGKPQNFVQLDQWLNERDCYDEIKKLRFFTKFWKWKTVKMWRTNIISCQTKKIKKQLEQKLFLIHPVLGKTLSIHKEFCCEIQALRFVDLIQQSAGEVSTLEQFIKSQKQKQDSVSKNIKKVSDNMKNNIYSSFKQCLKNLRISQQLSENLETKNIDKNHQQLAYEQLGCFLYQFLVPIDMTYEQKSELRIVCLRFLRFSYIIDFISIETLRNIYEESVSELLIQFEEIIQQNSNQKKKDAIFNLNIIPNFIDLDQNLFQIEEIKEYIQPPVGSSKIEEFNILYHVKLMKNNLDEDGDDTDILDETVYYQRSYVHNLNKYWLQISPSENEFAQTFMNIIGGGLNCLQTLERYSKHDDMTQFVSILEDWDDLVCDNWESPSSNYLNPSIYLTNNDKYKNQIQQIMKSAFSEIYTYLQKFDKLLMNYYENSKLNLDLFMDIRLSQPVDSYNNSFNILALQEQMIDDGISQTEDIGMLRIDFENLKSKLLPQPIEIVNALKKMLPNLIKTKTSAIKEWVNKQFSALKSTQGTINDFVRQQEQLKYCEKKFQKVKNQLSIIEQQSITLKSRKFELKKEDEQQLIEMLQQMNALQQQMQIVQETSEKQSGQFSKKISQSLIPTLVKQTLELNSQVQNQNFLEIDYGYHRSIKELRELKEQHQKLEQDAEKYIYYQQTLNMEVTQFEDLYTVKKDLDLRILIWDSLFEWQMLSEAWTDTPFDEINAEEIESQSNKYSKILIKLTKSLPNNSALDCLKQMVFEFKDTMPVVIALRNPALTLQHWKKIKNHIIGQDFDIKDPEFTVQSLFLMNVQQFQQEILDVSTQASQEALIEEQFVQIEAIWQKQVFIMEPYKQDILKDIYVVSSVEEIFQQMNECLTNLNSLLGSKYIIQKKRKLDRLLQEILQAQETIDDWLICQKNWIYLENIFSNQTQEVKKKLAQEYSIFEKVDFGFKKQLRTTFSQKYIYKIINPIVAKFFKTSKETLINIQKQLENYLEEKRDHFPRLYFLSNDELLEILAKTGDIASINKHTKKCFQNIDKFDLGNDHKLQMIEGIISGEGEYIQFTKPIQIKHEIEIWLGQVQEYMIENLTKKMKQAKQDYEIRERKDWVLDHPGQIVSTVAQIFWASQTEAYISNLSDNSNSMYDWQNVNYFQLDSLSELIKNDLSSIQHKIIVSLITQDVHARDIINQMIEQKIENTQDFYWLQQLRYYWEDNNNNSEVVIRQINCQIKYGYEYLGATSRLIITNLTDRCWLTITGALNIKMGAVSSGPTATGKTESIKDLAKSFGILCIVFNCNDQIEYKIIAKLLTGLVQQGAWTCLDQFNKINVQILSVLAQQLSQIRHALLKNEKNFRFMEKEISIKESVAVFITINQQIINLPDNLKILFRPISMMQPDIGLIAEIMLFAEGFQNAKSLGIKIVQLYKLSSLQLSQQYHYDFGMRSVKSVLLKISLKQDIVKTIIDHNIPKLIEEDIPLFYAIIKDIFNFDNIKNETLQFQNAFKDLNLTFVQQQAIKSQQLSETLKYRLGVMVIGQANSGKTTIIQILKHYQNVQQFILNPKAFDIGELYGEFNGRDWNDGLVSFIIKKYISDDQQDQKWIIFDGPVDNLWIEYMNTVFDDNMMLCLANGQRLQLTNNIRMLFEVQDLSAASPSTISRCGMVYIHQDDLSWETYTQQWILKNCPQDYQEYFMNIFLSYIDKFLDKIRSSFKEPIHTTNLQLIISMCNLMECFLTQNEGYTKEKKLKFYQNIFVFSIIWSLGSAIYELYQDNFDQFVRKLLTKSEIPHFDNVYGFFIEDIHFKPWSDIQPQFIYQKDENYFNLIVPTQDSIKYQYVTGILLNKLKMVYLVGPQGSGKSLFINNLLQKMQSIKLIFSAQTKSILVQQIIEQGLDQINKNTLGAIGEKKFVIFIDDMNMPQNDEFNTQAPIEFLRFLIDKKGMYDRKEKSWKNIQNTVILGCSNQRNQLCNRFTRHFNILCLPQPDEKTLFKIFDSILGGFLENGFQEPIKKLSEIITNSTIMIYQRLKQEKLPIPSKYLFLIRFYYNFNIRDISKVFQGMLNIKPQSIKDVENMIRLWIHECCRVFMDRLVEEDRQWFINLIMELLATQFSLLSDKDEIFGQNSIRFTDIINKNYEEIKDNNKLLNILQKYNQEFIFFQEAIDQILKITRILKQPRANALLIGVGGTGKQSLTRLSSLILDYQIKSINKNYNYTQFKDFIKNIMQITGNGQNLTFIFNDSQIIEETFIEDINSLLSLGEVPNIFDSEEKKKIIEEINTKQNKQGIQENYKTFVERVQNNLHIVLCMSPIGDSLRVRCRRFPSLVNCCQINVIDEWQDESLIAVASQQLQQFQDEAQMCSKIHRSVSKTCQQYYSIMKVYNPSKNYLDFLKIFQNEFEINKNDLDQQLNKLQNGLSKLEQANLMVAQLKIELTQLQLQIEKQSELVVQTLIVVEKDSKIAKEIEIKVQSETEKISKQAKEINQIADEAKTELDKAMPELNKALQAVENIDKQSLQQMRTFPNPPQVVELVMNCVFILLGKKYSWKNAQQELQELNTFIKKDILGYDKDNIPDNKIQKLNNFISQNEDLLQPKIVAEKASSAKDLFLWVGAMKIYYDIQKKVAPKKAIVQQLQQKQQEANESLLQKQNDLNEVKTKVIALKKESDINSQNKIDLQNLAEQTKQRLQNAENLTFLLIEEGKRWTETVANIKQDSKNLIGDILLKSAYINYCGPFNEEYRQKMIEEWQQYTQLVLKQQNIIFFTKGVRCPLFIDPQQQAIKYLKNLHGNLKITKNLEDVRKEIPFLVQEIENIDLDQIQQYDQLYLRTQNGNPHYLPETYSKFSIINFTVTFEILEEQILSEIVCNEMAEIEEQRDENIINLNRYKEKIVEYEILILNLLNESKQETLLDDSNLISTLEQSKQTSEQINIKIKQTIQKQTQIEQKRNQYKQVSIRASILFLVVQQLSNINHMYQFSLQYIKSLIKIAMSQKNQNLKDSITKLIFNKVSKGLFQKDKLIFAFLIAVEIEKNSGNIQEDLWQVFVKGPGDVNIQENPYSSVINNEQWIFINYLIQNFKQFQHLQNQNNWNVNDIDNFEQLIMFRVFNPDKLIQGISQFTKLILPQIEFNNEDDIDEESYVIFIFGEDPQQKILDFVDKKEMRDKFYQLSLGQGQEDAASQLIQQGRLQGNWVLLQNCHLAKSFMSQLEQILMQDVWSDPEYRLFLTTKVDKSIPVSILQNGVKLANEQPQGIRNNVLKSLSQLNDEYLDSCLKVVEFNKLILGLCFFHAIIQERNKFNYIGWNLNYEFNQTDLDTSKTIIYNLLNNQENIPWDSLNYIIGDITYGGRVNDQQDKLLLQSILNKFQNPKILLNHKIIPQYGKLSSYFQYIQNLSDIDDELLGLNQNTYYIYRTQQSNQFLNTISNQQHTQLIQNIEIPNIIMQNKEQSSPFLQQEIHKFNNLLIKIKSSYQSLINAIQGSEEMTSQLELIHQSIIINKVPQSWQAYPSLKPLASWIKDLQERVQFLEQWLLNGNPNSYWISAFYFPQGFLSSVIQTHASKYKIPIDQLKFEYKILDQNKNQIMIKPTDGVYIHGLFLEGATWNKKQKSLSEQRPGEIIFSMPVIQFIPTSNYKKISNDYICPLYKTAQRSSGQSNNYIISVDLPCHIDVGNLWILRGVALITQLNN